MRAGAALLGLLLLVPLLLLPPGCLGSCRRTRLPRDCEALCSQDRRGEVTSCELRAAVLLPGDPRYEISLPKVLPVLGESRHASSFHLRLHFNFLVFKFMHLI